MKVNDIPSGHKCARSQVFETPRKKYREYEQQSNHLEEGFQLVLLVSSPLHTWGCGKRERARETEREREREGGEEMKIEKENVRKE